MSVQKVPRSLQWRKAQDQLPGWDQNLQYGRKQQVHHFWRQVLSRSTSKDIPLQHLYFDIGTKQLYMLCPATRVDTRHWKTTFAFYFWMILSHVGGHVSRTEARFLSTLTSLVLLWFSFTPVPTIVKPSRQPVAFRAHMSHRGGHIKHVHAERLGRTLLGMLQPGEDCLLPTASPTGDGKATNGSFPCTCVPLPLGSSGGGPGHIQMGLSQSQEYLKWAEDRRELPRVHQHLENSWFSSLDARARREGVLSTSVKIKVS